jgi:C4-dicarboxylate transporter DctM subunit
MPLLKEAHYSDRDALGLVTATGSIGMLLPPCLPLILYAVIARIPMEQIFLGGLIPGTILVLATAAWGMWRAEKHVPRARTSWRDTFRSVNEAKWELLLPLVAFIALFSGLATPVEAAAVTALYAFITQVFVHRDLNLRGLTRVMVDCGSLIGGVLLILGVALGFTNYLVDAEVTDKVMLWVTATIHARWLFLLVLNLFMWLIGCLMDIYSAIVVQVPLLVLLGAAYGIDPVHLGIIFLANLELGYLTPPVGLNLIFASTRFRRPIPEVLRSVLPIIVVFFTVVMIITYVPALTTMLPRMFNQ